MNFKQTRQSASMTISQMAAYLGVDPRTVRRYEDGTRTPGGPVIKLYKALIKEMEARGAAGTNAPLVRL